MNDSKTKIQLEFQNNDSSEISSQSMNNVNETEMSTSAETNNNIMLPSTSREGNKLNLFLNKLNKKPMDQSSSDDEQSSLSQIFSTSGNDHPIIDPQSSTSGINGNSVQLSSSTDSEDFDFITDFNNIAVSNIFSNNRSMDQIRPVNQSSTLDKCSRQSHSSIVGHAHQSSSNDIPMIRNCSSIPSNMNFLKQCLKNIEMNITSKTNRIADFGGNNIRLNSHCSGMINSLAYNCNHKCDCNSHLHHSQYQHQPNHHVRTTGPSLLEQHMNQQLIRSNQHQKNGNNLEMISSVQATKIISNHSNIDNINSSNVNLTSAAVTTLTSSSTGLPVSALTVMESPKILNNRSHNWQAYMPTLKHRMATIFNRDILADVYFLVGKKSKTRFAAHKFVLSIGSPVFDAMFNGLLAKSSDISDKYDGIKDGSHEIELPDIEPEAFKALLRFLYLDEVDIDPETVMTTLYAAKKYEVLALEVECVNFLKANLNPENAFMLLTQARLFDEVNLADLCLETIDKHTINALQSEYFLDIDLDTLKIVLGRDTLRIREASLFAAILKWAESECLRKNLQINTENKRQVLSDAVYLLRFPLMTIEEFAVTAAQSGLLTDKEIVNMFLYYTVDSKCAIPFSFEPRCCITGEEYSVNRFQRTESRWGYSGSSDRIRFLTDRPIFVIGFGLYGSIQGQSEYEAIIEIIHTGSDKVVASNTTHFMSDGSDSTFKVMFQYPVEISQNTNYTACATLKGVDSYYGTNGCRTLNVNLDKGHAGKDTVTFQFSYAAGCNNGTSIEDGQIPEILFYV
ncbi:BTB/POZ domain-containing protein 1 [Dermatophagoides pteronyssinus]|uniref:BTB/POZ domain-containing protein 1 n=1 Tax=Dermatophagoides pteronyssinus TaxID=6956 RepID=A0ABQ8JAC8_DERPT|nr:BTB/POZ domain-containing protein 1 [Dermatophagoides pteronyssinus]